MVYRNVAITPPELKPGDRLVGGRWNDAEVIRTDIRRYGTEVLDVVVWLTEETPGGPRLSTVTFDPDNDMIVWRQTD